MGVIERFENKYIPEPNSGCWLWLGCLTGSQGYGYFCVKRHRMRAHRYSYELYKGPIPDGMVIDHLCRVPSCVNPDHLEAVTQKVNMQRGSRMGKRVPFCSKGHPRSGENLYISPNSGQYVCRECVRNSVRKYQKRKRDEQSLKC